MAKCRIYRAFPAAIAFEIIGGELHTISKPLLQIIQMCPGGFSVALSSVETDNQF